MEDNTSKGLNSVYSKSTFLCLLLISKELVTLKTKVKFDVQNQFQWDLSKTEQIFSPLHPGDDMVSAWDEFSFHHHS